VSIARLDGMKGRNHCLQDTGFRGKYIRGFFESAEKRQVVFSESIRIKTCILSIPG
jgi:hypothetical protein